jgi:hypothetical protein
MDAEDTRTACRAQGKGPEKERVTWPMRSPKPFSTFHALVDRGTGAE